MKQFMYIKYIFLFLAFFTFYTAQAQVKGIVKDNTGEPIPGANVFWMNTTNGVTTAEDGRFSISKPAKSHMLVVSFIGFEMIRSTSVIKIRNLILCSARGWN